MKKSKSIVIFHQLNNKNLTYISTYLVIFQQHHYQIANSGFTNDHNFKINHNL